MQIANRKAEYKQVLYSGSDQMLLHTISRLKHKLSNEETLTYPFRLTATDVLVDDCLCAVGEVAVLSLPYG